MYDCEWDLKYEVEVLNEEIVQEQEQEQEHSKFQEIFVLQPSLDDLWNNNVYQYTKNECKFLIPLWHHELIYDINGHDLLVEIKPRLPLNYWIDENNNLHKTQKYTMNELWDGIVNEKGINIFFGKRRFVFFPYKLQLKTHQTWVWENEGIPKIQNESIYDISRKCNVILHIHITSIH